MGIVRRITGDFEIRLAALERQAAAMTTRAEEIRRVAPNEHFIWLAEQMDELHVELSAGIHEVKTEVGAMKRLLTAVLVGILCGLVAVPVGIIWAAAVAGH